MKDLDVNLASQLAAKKQELRAERERKTETERVLAQVRADEQADRQRRETAALKLVVGGDEGVEGEK